MATDAIDWVALRDQAVMVGMLSRACSIEEIEAWIQQGERSLSIGPVLDATLFQRAGGELQTQLRYMRAYLAFRREVEAIAAAGSNLGITGGHSFAAEFDAALAAKRDQIAGDPE